MYFINYEKFLLFACVVVIFTLVFYLQPQTKKKPCYYSDYGDALPSTEDPGFSPKAQSIFFHEISCTGGFNPRQACAVEAAARTHPQRDVYLLFCAPVTSYTLKTSSLKYLKKLYNIKFARLHIKEYLKGTPVESLLSKLDKSKYPVHHAADILRIVTLNKWGGIYLDTDMIVTRSLDSLPLNFIARESDAKIGTGVFSFAKDEVGSNVTNMLMREITDRFDANEFNNGRMAVQSVFENLCPIFLDSTTKKSITLCNGVSVYNQELFYPYYFLDVDSFFVNPAPSDLDLERPYAYHMWNFCSESTKVIKNSTYELIAKTFCPTIYAAYPKEFEIVQTNEEDDALPSAEDPNFVPRPDSIFFHEASQRGGLNSRQACSVESAARAHPTRQIYVLFSAPMRQEVYRGRCIGKLRELPNIKFARVHLTEYGKNTPLEAMLARNPFKASNWPVQHASDVLRYLTLYKWGGVYLDTDMVVVKSLTPLGHNWAAKENDISVSNGALALSMDDLGRRLASALVEELKLDYRPDLWSYNGPLALMRVLSKTCNASSSREWSSKNCQGMEIYWPPYFYPVHYANEDQYFEPGELEYIDDPYAHHFWNKINFDRPIKKDSLYVTIAKKFCPTVYEIYGDDFGN